MPCCEKLRAELTANSDYVGPKFPEEARKIHFDEAPARGIHGEATLKEAQELTEEGVPIFPAADLAGRSDLRETAGKLIVGIALLQP